MKDDEEILMQDEDDLEEDISNLEEEEIQSEPKKAPKKKRIDKQIQETEEINETYEGFIQPARLGIVNTITGDIIEGFTTGKDEGLVQLGKAILNRLDKIAIASGV